MENQFTKAMADVLNERAAQSSREGFTTDHDDQHECMELAAAGACYAENAAIHREYDKTEEYECISAPPEWPWGGEWWKPKGCRQDLVRAAALIIAEIERIDRQQ